jgi:hypothetical protein
MGKSSPPPPDYTPLANASKEAAQIMAGLGQDQLAFAREQYERSAPILEGIAESQIAAQNEQMTQGRDYYNYMSETFRPLERQIVADAQNFNTDAYREQLASQAAADVGLAFGRTQAANQRAMAAMGVNPNSGRFAGVNAASNLGLAANRAAVMTGSRVQSDQMGYARQLDAAGLGRGLSGASLAAYGGATASGNAAGQNAQSAGQNYMGNMAIGAGTIGQGQNMRIQGLSSVLNAQTNAYVNSNDSFLGDVGGLLGGAASVYTAFGSDRRLKENVREIGVDQRTALTLYEFNYKTDPDKKFVGVMADEVELVYPEAVTTREDGFKAVYYEMLGIEFKEVA